MLPPVIFALTKPRAICLLDLPRSIADAQCSQRQLRSTGPDYSPYQTPEPKGAKRTKWLADLPADDLHRDRDMQLLVSEALAVLRCRDSFIPWCWDREHLAGNVVPSQECARRTIREQHRDDESNLGVPLVLSTPSCHLSAGTLDGAVVHNPYNCECVLVTGDRDRNTYYIPPRSSFINSSIERGQVHLNRALQVLVPQTGLESGEPGSGNFDLIVMDPPWSNRSVRRSHEYHTQEHQELDPFELSLRLIDQHLKADGVVAIWITNKPRIRAQVEGSFRRLGLSVLEEWVWIKITAHGEPVTPLEGVWRRPFETILLLSKRSPGSEMVRKVIAAVPDLHSRKPSLKRLLEAYVPSPYQALELFARNLTAGWWSWGDEVLKFQHEQHWHEAVRQP